jgi:hypothetical protein
VSIFLAIANSPALPVTCSYNHCEA